MTVKKVIKHTYSIMRINILSIVQYTFIFCVILNFRSVWLHSISFELAGKIVKYLMGISVLLGVLCKRNIQLIKIRKCIIVLGITFLYGLIWYLFDSMRSGSIIVILVQLFAIIVYCLLVENSIDDTIHKYVNIVLGIAIISLVFWVSGPILGVIKPTGYIYSTWTGNDSVALYNSYYGIYFVYKAVNFFNIKVVMNIAIFTEGPMASMIFSIAFLAEFLMQREINVKRCFILLVAVISTISTTGFTVLIIAFVLKYRFNKQDTYGRYIKMVVMPIIIILAFLALSFLVEQKLMTTSGSTRVDDFVAGYKAWLDAPLFGNGYGNTDSFKRYMSNFRSYNKGFSNSPMEVLAFGGIYLFLPYLVALVGIIRLFRKRMWLRMSFYIIFFYAFVITICPFQMLTFYLFISMAREGTNSNVAYSVSN